MEASLVTRLANRGLTVRIILVQVAALVALGLGLGLINYRLASRDLESQVTQRAVSLSRSLARSGKLGVLTGDGEALGDLLGGLQEEVLFSFATFRSSKGVLASWGTVPDLSFLGESAADEGGERIVPEDENPTGLILIVAPVKASMAAEASFEEDFLSLAAGDGTAKGGGAQGETVVGALFTGLSRSQIERPLQATLRVNLLVVFGSVVVMSALLSFILVVSFRPLGNIAEAFREIAMGEGDLTRRIEVSTKDEIGTAGRCFNTFAEYLHKVVSKVGTTIQTVDTTSAVLTSGGKKLLAGANTQISEITRAVESVEDLNGAISSMGTSIEMVQRNMEKSSASASELATSIREIEKSTNTLFSRVDNVNGSLAVMNQSLSESAQSVGIVREGSESTAAALSQFDSAVRSIEQHTRSTADISRDTGKVAKEGARRMEEAIGGMESISEAFEEIRRHMGRLAEHMMSVGEMLSTIKEVADQTNLLSLNASILAAQAGEHGVGFSVVAEEIGSLAETSAGSAKRIAKVLALVKQQSDRVNASMEIGFAKVTAGRDLTHHARESLQGIISGVKDIVEHIQQIVISTKDQSRNSSLLSQEAKRLSETIGVIEQSSRLQSEESARISEGVNEIRDGTARVQKAISEQMQNSGHIEAAMSRINEEQAKIHSSIQVQEERSGEILRSMDRIRKVSEEHLRVSEEMENLIGTTRKHTEHLRLEVERLKV